MKHSLLFVLAASCLLVSCQSAFDTSQSSAHLQAQSRRSDSNWQELPSMPEPRYNLQTTAIQGKIYASGGFNDRAVLDSFEVFDPNTRQWQTLPEMPSPRYIHGAAALDSSLYVVGGYRLGAKTSQLLMGAENTKGAMSQVDRYDTKKQRWESLTALQTPRFMPAVVAHQGQIFVAGGGGPDRQLLSSIEVYQPQTRQWKKSFELPEARVWGQLLSDGRYLYWIGGVNASKTFLNQIDRLDLQTGQWQQHALPPMPIARAGFSAAMTPEGMYAIGGNGPQGFIGQADFLDFKTKQWRSLPDIQPGRAGTGLVVDSRGLWLFGTDAWYTNNTLFLPHFYSK